MVECVGFGVLCLGRCFDWWEYWLQVVVGYVVVLQVLVVLCWVVLLCGDELWVGVGSVLYYQFDDDVDIVCVGSIDQVLECGLVVKVWIDVVVIGDIVVIVMVGVVVEWQQLQVVDIELLQVVQFFGDVIQCVLVVVVVVVEQVGVDLVDCVKWVYCYGVFLLLFMDDQFVVVCGSGL